MNYEPAYSESYQKANGESLMAKHTYSLSRRHRGYVYGMLAVLIWSGFILASRQGGLSQLTPYDVIAIRYSVCAVLVSPLLFYIRIDLFTARTWAASLVGALLYALFTFHGFQHVPASQAAILLPGLIPVFVTMASVFLLKESIAPLKWMGIALITLSAAVLLGLNSKALTGTAFGYGAIIMGALCWGVYSTLIKKWKIEPWPAVISLAITTCIMYLPVYLLWLPKNLAHTPWPDILLQGIYQGFLATMVQMWLYVRAVQLIGAQNMGALMVLVPIFAGAASILVFNEPVHFNVIIAYLLAFFGLYLQQKPQPTFVSHYKET